MGPRPLRASLALLLAASLVRQLSAQTAAAPGAREFRVEAAHSQVAFSVGFLGLPVRGRFDDVRGVVVYTPAAPESSSVTVAIATRSVSTGSAHRDEHLRSDDFFDAERYPTILFRSRTVRRRGDRLEVIGPLVMRGVTREVTIPFREVAPPIRDPHGSTLLTFSGALRLARRDFGVLGGARHNPWFDAARNATVSDSVDVTLDVQAWDADPDRAPSLTAPLGRIDRDGLPAVIARLRALHTRAPDSLAANGAEWELVHIARGMLLLGRARDAGELLAFAAEVFPRSASVAAAHGRALEALGDRAGALAAASRALALDPYDPAALELRRRLTGGLDAPAAPVRIR